MMKKLTFGLAAASLSAIAAAQAGTIVIEDEVGSLNGNPEIDFYSFVVTEEGEVTLTVDASGVGYMGSGLDSYLILATDDGERTVDDVLARNDDGGPGLDSIITIDLPAGSYLVGVSSCCITNDEFVAGGNLTVSYNGGSNFAYRLTIDGMFVEADAVPVPAAAALFVPALLGGAALRRRRA